MCQDALRTFDQFIAVLPLPKRRIESLKGILMAKLGPGNQSGQAITFIILDTLTVQQNATDHLAGSV